MPIKGTIFPDILIVGLAFTTTVITHIYKEHLHFHNYVLHETRITVPFDALSIVTSMGTYANVALSRDYGEKLSIVSVLLKFVLCIISVIV